jgi:hypothetical protein
MIIFNTIGYEKLYDIKGSVPFERRILLANCNHQGTVYGNLSNYDTLWYVAWPHGNKKIMEPIAGLADFIDNSKQK